MARPKKYENSATFTEPDTQTKPIESYQRMPPSVRAKREIMSSDEKRLVAAEAMSVLRKSWKMSKVNSNQELLERIDAYFDMVEDRAIPPTIEEMSLYCGYTSATLHDWQSGKNHGFKDEPEPGLTTSLIIKKAKELLHSFDAVMAELGCINFLAYCFRSKNYYGMTDKQEITVSASDGTRQPLSPEEIAKNLPEPVYTDDIQTDYNVTDG